MGGSLKAKAGKPTQVLVESRAGALLSLHFSKVRVRNIEGKYLALNGDGLTFSYDRSRALVFDYAGDEIRAQLSALARIQDLPLELVPVEPKDFLEKCDCCQQLAPPTEISFDGAKFVCHRCVNWAE